MSTRPRVGVCILPEYPWAQAAPLWRAAEELGFDHAWTYDHMTWSGLPEAPWYAAMPTLAAAALTTSRIGLGTFVSSPNNHHPAQFIREILAVDDLSQGRFLCGVGAGGNIDAEVTGETLTRGERTRRFREFTVLLRRLLHEDKVSADGAFVAAQNVRTLPGPLNTDSSTRVPLIVAANGPMAIRLAVEQGDAWMTYGGNADTTGAWWGMVAEAAARVDDACADLGRTSPFARYLGLDSAPNYAFGSVEACRDALGRAAELGFTDVVAAWPRSSDPYAGSRDVLEQIAAEVLA